MTTPHSPRLLVLSTVLLAVAGAALLCMPHDQQPPAPATPSTAQATTDRSSIAAMPSSGRPATDGSAASTASEASTPSADESALPPHGEGVAGDRAIQRNLETAWPADLPAGDERELLTAGRALLRADATGVGRATWPDVFADSGQEVVPAFATARFRIQAAIARRAGSPTQAVVHLVWAGTDRGGTFTDLRITDWHFTRTAVKKGAATWAPQPRT
ncbi:hypothetical protein ABZ904_44885 [Streptomyces sp. NPDC046900]|uniref:hypothetical protein n=1 Tax=Streptomyces sp. NPDC046900 TaxID=3155473 RepID=UPI0033D3151B